MEIVKDFEAFRNEMDIKTQEKFSNLTLESKCLDFFNVYTFQLNMMLRKTKKEKIRFIIDIDISKNIQTCEIKAKCLKQYIEKEHLMLEEFETKEFETLWEQHKHVWFSLYLFVLHAFETFIQKYPVIRMDYVFKQDSFFAHKKPETLDDFKKEIVRYEK